MNKPKSSLFKSKRNLKIYKEYLVMKANKEKNIASKLAIKYDISVSRISPIIRLMQRLDVDNE